MAILQYIDLYIYIFLIIFGQKSPDFGGFRILECPDLGGPTVYIYIYVLLLVEKHNS